MTFTLPYSNLSDTKTVRDRAGLPAVMRQLMAHVGAWRQQAAAQGVFNRDRRDAAYVRRLAYELRESDPGMASDLEAAVARQEAQTGTAY